MDSLLNWLGRSKTQPVSEGVSCTTSAQFTLSSAEKRESRVSELLQEDCADLHQLRGLVWHGLGDFELRGDVWRLLLDYLPAERARRPLTLKRKREEYFDLLKSLYTPEIVDLDILCQIEKDLPRTRPEFPLFQQKSVQGLMKRVLYVLAIRNPASGYVQGINELCAPFVLVFLQCDPCAVTQETVTEAQLSGVEPDTYWCLSALMASLHEFFTPNLPGVQRCLSNIRELLPRIDYELGQHLSAEELDPMDFAYRWVSCFMMRDLPFRFGLLVWDALMCDDEGFPGLCTYLALALIKQLKRELIGRGFSEMIMVLQNSMYRNWKTKDVQVLVAEAYYFKCLYRQRRSLGRRATFR